ncbi:MAG: hypothetical protein D6784_17635 [Chloroflexi bacterium]|nr:MAG: hypothetical protein D6784_17635 [Chloroflexota bacterium]
MSRPSYGKPTNPKPYDFVPFAGKVRRQNTAGHDRLDLDTRFSGRLVIRFEVLTPLFIGDGSYALGRDAGFPEEKVIRPFHRVGGVPTVPGASLKGVVRSIVEAVSPSCLTTTRVPFKRLPKNVELTTSYRATCKPTHACPACSMFGRTSQQAKVSVGDASLLEGGRLQLFRLAPLYAPRAFKTPPAYLDKRGNFRGLKFYFHSRPHEDERQPPVEVIPPGRKLQGMVTFENLSSPELGLLFFALGMEGSISLKLGGGKPLGLGSVQTVEAELTLLGIDYYLQTEDPPDVKSGAELAGFVDRQVRAAVESKLLQVDRAQKLIEILAYKPGRHAPDGAY